jgi:hypothetical protein
VAERFFAPAPRLRCLIEDYGFYPNTLADFYNDVFVRTMLKQAAQLTTSP